MPRHIGPDPPKLRRLSGIDRFGSRNLAPRQLRSRGVCPKPGGRPRGEARYFAQLFGRRSPKHVCVRV